MYIPPRQKTLLGLLSQTRILKFFLKNNMNYKYSSNSPEIKDFFINPLFILGYKETSILRCRIKIAICTYTVNNNYFIRIIVHGVIKGFWHQLQDVEVKFIQENWELIWKNNEEPSKFTYFYLA